MLKYRWLIGAAALVIGSPALADEASLRREIAALRAQLDAQAAELARLEARVNQQNGTPATVVHTAEVAQDAQAPSQSAVPQPLIAEGGGPATTVGGYGEAVYNHYLKDRSRDLADLRRVVLLVGHRFSDKLSVYTETEVEHAVASASDPGEIEIEQAYLNYRFSPALNVKGGLFLLPFGLLNRNHEPNAYYGVNRNEVETRIIPTTLREGGIGVDGLLPFGLAYDVGLTTGYDVAKFDDPSAPLAGMHQELALAHAANLSVYGSLEYRGIPGLVVGSTISSGNSGQGNAAFRANPNQPNLAGIKARTTLWDVHARYQFHGFDFRALYARGTIGQAGRVTQGFFAANAADGGNRPPVPSAFYGWYLEGAYTFELGGDMTLSPFARYERYNTQARRPLGLAADPANRDKLLTAGISFKPLPEVVMKADYQKFFENSANDRINLGLGYSF